MRGPGLAYCESASIVDHDVNLSLVRQDFLDNSLYIIVLCHVHNHRTNVFMFETLHTLEASRRGINSTSSFRKLFAPKKKHPWMRISTEAKTKAKMAHRWKPMPPAEHPVIRTTFDAVVDIARTPRATCGPRDKGFAELRKRKSHDKA